MRFFRRLVPVLAGPLLTLLLIAFCPLPLLAEEEVEEAPLSMEGVPTNLGLAHELTQRVAAKSLTALASEMKSDCFQGLAATDHSGNPLMDLALAQSSRNAGLRMSVGESDCGIDLEYQILEMRIVYTDVDRSAFGFSKEIERHAICVLASRLVDSDSGEELATTQQEVLVSDRFPYDLEKLLRSESYSFTSPEIPEKDWSKAAEPIVVTALISGLIYLFFSNQSGD